MRQDGGQALPLSAGSQGFAHLPGPPHWLLLVLFLHPYNENGNSTQPTVLLGGFSEIIPITTRCWPPVPSPHVNSRSCCHYCYCQNREYPWVGSSPTRGLTDGGR